MFRKFLPLLLPLAGLGVGMAVGIFLRPSDETALHEAAPSETDGHAEADAPTETGGHEAAPTDDHAAPKAEDHAVEETSDHGEGGPEYVKMNNQFVVPVVEDGRVNAMVVLAISLEVEPGNTENVYLREPKLRDTFLQVMFDHANVGGFSGSFTDSSNLVVLRTNLKEAAAMILGTAVRDVLITDIARQDS